MELAESLEEFAPVAKAFEQLQIRYQLGGSVASSAYGIPRGTLDIDVEADLKPEHINSLVQQLDERYILTPAMIRDALRTRACFNLIPYDSIAKIDIFVLKGRPYDVQALERRQFGIPLDDGTSAPYWVNAVEDVILRKLEWYRLGGEVSEQKWNDVLGVVKVQQFDIDIDYLEKWATELRVSDLLKRAFDHAGLSDWIDSSE